MKDAPQGTSKVAIAKSLEPCEEYSQDDIERYINSYGGRLNHIATEVDRQMDSDEQGTSKVAIAKSLEPCEEYSQKDIERYIDSGGARLNQIASEVDQLMKDAPQGTSKVAIARSLEPCEEYSQDDIERYIECFNAYCYDESFLEKYDFVEVQQEGNNSIEVKCTKCETKRWTHFILKDGSDLKQNSRVNSILMGLQRKRTVGFGDTNSVVLENGLGRNYSHAENEVNKFFGKNYFFSKLDVGKKSQKIAGGQNGPEYFPVYNQKKKKGRFEIGRISFAPNISSDATIVVNACKCGTVAWDPVDANHGRELVGIGVIYARKQREINSDDEEEGEGEEYYRSQTIRKLQALCKRRGLDRSGKKQELIDRLIDNDIDNDENHNL
jgi:hypothetical protein